MNRAFFKFYYLVSGDEQGEINDVLYVQPCLIYTGIENFSLNSYVPDTVCRMLINDISQFHSQGLKRDFVQMSFSMSNL